VDEESSNSNHGGAIWKVRWANPTTIMNFLRYFEDSNPLPDWLQNAIPQWFTNTFEVSF
tara:strand:+ start:28 stop:204 length:177 start_codon:yes stop_codon:yes gene_type:complete